MIKLVALLGFASITVGAKHSLGEPPSPKAPTLAATRAGEAFLAAAKRGHGADLEPLLAPKVDYPPIDGSDGWGVRESRACRLLHKAPLSRADAARLGACLKPHLVWALDLSRAHKRYTWRSSGAMLVRWDLDNNCDAGASSIELQLTTVDGKHLVSAVRLAKACAEP